MKILIKYLKMKYKKNASVILWALVFVFSLCLHFGMLYYLSNKEDIIVKAIPQYNNRDFQLVIFDKENDKVVDKTSFLAKHNYSTTKEQKLKELASSMLMAESNNLTKEFAEHLQKPSGSMDFLPDVDYGDVMSLNTRTFKYYGFYERIEKTVSPYWSYKVRDLLRNKQNLFKNSITKDYVTEIKAIINKDGELVKVIVLKSSKVKELDALCENVFAELSPFINPPKTLLKNGQIAMNWRFILSVVKDISFKILPF